MKRAYLVVLCSVLMLCLAICGFSVLAQKHGIKKRPAGQNQSQTNKSQTNKSQTNTSQTGAAKTVTIEGCIKDNGGACFWLLDTNSYKRYSIARDSNLEVNGAYQIIGTVSATNSCQTNYSLLVPNQITKLDKLCGKMKVRK